MKNLALAAATLGGCIPTDSSTTPTSEIYASISAKAAGDGVTTVTVSLYVGDPSDVGLLSATGGDRLVAIHLGREQRMVETEHLGLVSHRAQFAGDDEGLAFEVAFLRDVDDGAPSSRMALPAKFTLDPAPASASRAAPLTLSWSPAVTPDLMTWYAWGDCIQFASGVIHGDPMSFEIPGGTLQPRAGTADSCAITIEVHHINLGQLDPRYGRGGSAGASQAREITLTSTQ